MNYFNNKFVRAFFNFNVVFNLFLSVLNIWLGFRLQTKLCFIISGFCLSTSLFCYGVNLFLISKESNND